VARSAGATNRAGGRDFFPEKAFVLYQSHARAMIGGGGGVLHYCRADFEKISKLARGGKHQRYDETPTLERRLFWKQRPLAIRKRKGLVAGKASENAVQEELAA